MFAPFTQENRDDASLYRGSGLGLAIVKKIVDLMGGRIKVDSHIGTGTTFRISLVFDCVPQNAMLNKRYGAVPFPLEQYPDRFVAFADLSSVDRSAYLKMVAMIDSGAETASCIINPEYHVQSRLVFL